MRLIVIISTYCIDLFQLLLTILCRLSLNSLFGFNLIKAMVDYYVERQLLLLLSFRADCLNTRHGKQKNNDYETHVFLCTAVIRVCVCVCVCMCFS